MFKKNLKNVKIKRGKFGLLDKALGLLSTYLDIDEYEAIEDSYGKIAYDIFTHLLVAKKSPYGNIVSVNKSIWDKSVKEKRPILMFIAKSEYFYEFKSWLIKETTINMRGDSEMVNFSISQGKNLMRYLQDNREAIKKNDDYLRNFSKQCL